MLKKKRSHGSKILFFGGNSHPMISYPDCFRGLVHHRQHVFANESTVVFFCCRRSTFFGVFHPKQTSLFILFDFARLCHVVVITLLLVILFFNRTVSILWLIKHQKLVGFSPCFFREAPFFVTMILDIHSSNSRV